MSSQVYSYRGSFLEGLQDIGNDFKVVYPEKEHEKLSEVQSYEPEENDLKLSIEFSNEKASQVVDQIIVALEKIDTTGCFDEIRTYIMTVATEFVRNGIVQNYKEMSFTPVVLNIYDNEDAFFITVEDQFGSLRSYQIADRLKIVASTGEYEKKVYGAGLGLFMAISNLDWVKFQVVPERSTRVIGKMKKYRRLKKFKEKKTIIIFDEKEK